MTYSTVRASPNTSPIFVKYPIVGYARLAGQVVNRDPGVSNPVLLLASNDKGSFIESIEVNPLGVNIQTVLRLYLLHPVISSSWLLVDELLLPAVTTAPADNVITGYPLSVVLPPVLFPASSQPGTPNRGLRLPANSQLAVALGTAVASGYNVIAYGGDY